MDPDTIAQQASLSLDAEPVDPREAVRSIASEVAMLRRQQENLDYEQKQLTELYQATPYYRDYAANREKLDALKLALARKEADLRQGVTDLYYATGDKQTPYGTAKIHRNVIYLEAQAIEWCAKHYTKGLALDKKVFEQAALAMDLDFVTVEPEVKVALKSDLSEYLPKE